MKFLLFTYGYKGGGGYIGRRIGFVCGSHIICGRNNYIGDYAVFESDSNGGAEIIIGDRVWISRGFHMLCLNRIHLHDDVILGEYVSIRDSTHGSAELDIPFIQQENCIGSVIVENNVWIGRGVLIQSKSKELRIGHGSIIGANSVVVHSIPPMEVWGGVPAKFLKRRT